MQAFIAVMLAGLLLITTRATISASADGTDPSQGGGGAGPESDQSLIIAGHFLRRLGFGPTPQDLNFILTHGPAAWVAQQMDARVLQRCINRPDHRYAPGPPPNSFGYEYAYRWLTRMVYSPCQLQEKMTLFWHERFATSMNKYFVFIHMRNQENFFRANALGNLRVLLFGVTVDNAMLGWLDNDNNNGNEETPANENYARELLQLFAVGPYKLTDQGEVVTIDGTPQPAYTEDDVKALARQLTGWSAQYPIRMVPETMWYDPTEEVKPAQFDPLSWNCMEKTFSESFGDNVTLPANCENPDQTGETQVWKAIGIVMGHPNVAPFFVTEFLKKFYKERLDSKEDRRLVYDLVKVFRASGGDVAAVLGAAFHDPRFVTPPAVRTMYKTPIEQLTNMIRGLSGQTNGSDMHDVWGYETAYRLFEPPSVFSFYRPGRKSALVNTALVVGRDSAAADFAANPPEGAAANFDAAQLIRHNRIRTADEAINFLARNLLAAPLHQEVRALLAEYIGTGPITPEKFRGAAFLLMASPDFQVN